MPAASKSHRRLRAMNVITRAPCLENRASRAAPQPPPEGSAGDGASTPRKTVRRLKNGGAAREDGAARDDEPPGDQVFASGRGEGKNLTAQRSASSKSSALSNSSSASDA